MSPCSTNTRMKTCASLLLRQQQGLLRGNSSTFGPVVHMAIKSKVDKSATKSTICRHFVESRLLPARSTLSTVTRSTADHFTCWI